MPPHPPCPPPCPPGTSAGQVPTTTGPGTHGAAAGPCSRAAPRPQRRHPAAPSCGAPGTGAHRTGAWPVREPSPFEMPRLETRDLRSRPIRIADAPSFFVLTPAEYQKGPNSLCTKNGPVRFSR